MRLSSCISLDLLYRQNGDEPSENLKRYIFTAVLLFQLPFSTININTENKNLLSDDVVTLTRCPVSN